MQVVKRKDHLEKYDKKKVYASCYAAAINAHYSEKEAEKLADNVMKKINSWIKSKKKVDSSHIRDQIIKNISDKEVALMYKHHLDIC